MVTGRYTSAFGDDLNLSITVTRGFSARCRVLTIKSMIRVVACFYRYRPFQMLLLLALCAPLLLNAQELRSRRKYVPPPPTSRITVIVTKASNGKPVQNAAVVFHPLKDGKNEGDMELKTNEEGKAVIDVIPIGDTLRLQIIADGFQTFGDDFPIKKATRTIAIKLLPPARQYSVYQKHNGEEQGGEADQPGKAQKPQ